MCTYYIYICVYIYIHLSYILTSLCGRKKRGSHHPTPQLTDFWSGWRQLDLVASTFPHTSNWCFTQVSAAAFVSYLHLHAIALTLDTLHKWPSCDLPPKTHSLKRGNTTRTSFSMQRVAQATGFWSSREPPAAWLTSQIFCRGVHPDFDVPNCLFQSSLTSLRVTLERVEFFFELFHYDRVRFLRFERILCGVLGASFDELLGQLKLCAAWPKAMSVVHCHSFQCFLRVLHDHIALPPSLGLRLFCVAGVGQCAFCVAGVGQCALPRGRMYALASLGLAWQAWDNVHFAWQVWDNVHCQGVGCTPWFGCMLWRPLALTHSLSHTPLLSHSHSLTLTQSLTHSLTDTLSHTHTHKDRWMDGWIEG